MRIRVSIEQDGQVFDLSQVITPAELLMSAQPVETQLQELGYAMVEKVVHEAVGK